MASLWTQAQAAAQDGLAGFRNEAQVAVLEAQKVNAAAESDRATALAELGQAHHMIQVATERTLQLERDLATAQASNTALVDQLAAAVRQQMVLEAAVTESRRDFAVELEKLRQALE